MSARNLIKNEIPLAAMLPEHLRPLFGAFIVTLKVVADEDVEPSAAALDGLVLDYKAKVSPSAWGIFEEKVPLSYLVGKLKDLEGSDKAAASVLDLSCNNLCGDDVHTVVHCVEALRPDSSADGPLTVILRNNRLFQCMPAVQALLAHPKVEFVDVTINPIASLDSKDAIKGLPSALRQKLIFLLPQHLKAHVLEIMTDKDPSMMADVEVAHAIFYERFSKALG